MAAIESGLTVSMAFKAALLEPRPVVVPLATTEETDGDTMSPRSRSTTVRVPLVLNAALVSAKVLAALSAIVVVLTVMSGASLVPMIVIFNVP